MQKTERGRLKIFFSYAEGSGKTQAMLREAQALKKRGEDVVVGCQLCCDFLQNFINLLNFAI
jgi:K+-sensing histidine kinase KdpD